MQIKGKSPTVKHQQRIIIKVSLLKKMNSDVSAKAKCLKQLILVHTLRRAAHLAGTVYICGSCGDIWGVIHSCCGLSLLLLLLLQRPEGSRKIAVKTQSHWSNQNIQYVDLRCQGDTYFWFCSISSRADKADVPFLPCGGGTGSVGYGGIGLVTCSPFIGVPFCCVQKWGKKGKEMDILA